MTANSQAHDKHADDVVIVGAVRLPRVNFSDN